MNLGGPHETNNRQGDSESSSLAFWFVGGVLFAVVTQSFFVWRQAGGDWTFLLHVGPDPLLQRIIVDELGPVAVHSGGGHDGQFFFAIARDPLNRAGTGEAIAHVNPRYRYRRILYPLLAGAGGAFNGHTTMWSMIMLSWIATGFATATAAAICQLWHLPRWTPLLCLMNPGVLYSFLTLTADILALGFSLTAVLFFLTARRPQAVLFCVLAALTKETYLLFPLMMGVALLLRGKCKSSVIMVATPVLPVAAWGEWIGRRLPPTPVPVQNFGWPGAGIVDAFPKWFDPRLSTHTGDIVWGLLALLLLATGIVCVVSRRNRFLSLLGGSWCLLAVMLSMDIWGRPHNVLRVLAPLWMISAMHLAWMIDFRSHRDVMGRELSEGDDKPGGEMDGQS